MTADTVGMAPYFSTLSGPKQGNLESLYRCLLILADRVDESSQPLVAHCLEMLEEAFPDPAHIDGEADGR